MRRSAIISLSVFSTIALALISFGIYFIFSAESSSNWEKTSAKVISYKIVSSRRQGSGVIKKRQYAIQIKYQYDVKQISYTNNMISFGKGVTLKSSYKDRDKAIKWLNNSEFARNKIIDIYYNPKNPNKSVVYKGINFITFIPLILGLFFMLLIVFVLKKRNDNQNA